MARTIFILSDEELQKMQRGGRVELPGCECEKGLRVEVTLERGDFADYSDRSNQEQSEGDS